MIIKDLQLCSFKEQKALKVKFDKKRNLIFGVNDTGKSCLMKSIYYTLGAPVTFEDVWLNAQVLSLITFELDGVQYSILRDEKTFSVYDKNLEHLKTFTSITTGIGKFLADLFNFQLKLLNRGGEDTTPTPAFMFLPFYIDQDKGWAKSFDSFDNLKQFADYRNPTIEFHTGVRPNEYYSAKIEQKKLNEEKGVFKKDNEIVEAMLDRSRKKFKEFDFSFSATSFKEEATELVQKANSIRDKQQSYREVYRNLYDELHVASHQMMALEKAFKASTKDFTFSTEQPDDSITCPTCHTEFENSFNDRIEIAKDLNQFDQMYVELKSRTLLLQAGINEHKETLKPLEDELHNTEMLLLEKKKTLELQDLIQAEGRREMLEELKYQRTSVSEKIAEIDTKLSIVEEKIKGFQDKEKKKSVESTYIIAIKKFLNKLDVNNIPEEKFKKITSVIEKSGSDKPRALLAYFYGIIETIMKHSTFMSCPLVIDSPNQQAQDETNIQRILEIIRDHSPDDSQIILAVEGLHGVNFNWHTINLEKKLSLLQESQYEELSKTFRSLVQNRKIDDET